MVHSHDSTHTNYNTNCGTVEPQVSKLFRHFYAFVPVLSCIKNIKRNKMSNKYCSGGLFIYLAFKILH